MKRRRNVCCWLLLLCFLLLIAGCGRKPKVDGYYKLKELELEGEKAKGSELALFGAEESYLVLEKDGSGYLYLITSLTDLTWKSNVITVPNGEISYIQEEDTLTLADEMLTAVFRKSEGEIPPRPEKK